MSYILDALRRAEAERQRGAVPGLHAQPTVVAVVSKAPRLRLLAVAAAAAGALGAAAGAAWWLGRQAAPGVREAPAAATPEGKPAAVPPATPTPATVAAPAPVSPQVVVMVNPPPAAVPVAPAAVPVVRAASTVVVAALPPLPPPASTPVALPRFADLPEAVRATLPALALGGIVHASAAAQRLVILGGQVFHEGDRPLPDLLVQEIRPRTVVLVWRGQAFEFGP